MKSLKLWFGIALVAIAVVLCYPSYLIGRWGVALVRKEREGFDPETREFFDELVGTLRTMGRTAREG